MAEAVAVFVREPAAVGMKATVTLAAAPPGNREPREEEIVLPLGVRLAPSEFAAETKVTPAGNTLLKETFTMPFGPEFVTVNVLVTISPAKRVETDEEPETTRSAIWL